MRKWEKKTNNKYWGLIYKKKLSFRDDSFLQSEAKYDRKHGEELQILTLKQILQTLPIALAYMKTGNASENLLN